MSRSLYADLAGSGEQLECLSDERLLATLLRVEVALSRAAGTPAEAAAAAATIAGYRLDPVDIARRSAAGGNPVIPIVSDLKAIDPTGIHPGATSQDIIDTALMVCLRDAVGQIRDTLDTYIRLLTGLTRTHRESPVMGRTLGQIATPTTFGAVTGGWLVAALSARRELRRMVFPVSFGGAAGTMAASHPHGWEIQSRLAAELGLHDPGWVWHSDRTPVTGIAAALATTAGVVRKTAGDIIFYSQNEVGELRERNPGGSSAMPHKANPAAAIACDGYARRAPGLLATLFDALDCRLQRGTGSWHAEWLTLRELAALTDAALARAVRSLDGIEVDTAAMAARVDGPTGHAVEIADRALALTEKEN